MSKLWKKSSQVCRSIDAFWEQDELVVLGNLNQAIMVHNGVRYLVYWDSPYQLGQYFKNGKVAFDMEATSSILYFKNKEVVFRLLHREKKLLSVGFPSYRNNQISLISLLFGAKKTTYHLEYGHKYSFYINEDGPYEHETYTSTFLEKEKSFRYYDKLYNIYQRYLNEKH